jgi:hypothetical protein
MPEMNIGSGDYFPENHVFYIDAIYETIAFTSILNPLFVSPAILMAFLTNMDFSDAARYAYWSSQEVDLILSINGVTGTTANTPEVQQLTLYLALDRIYTHTTSDREDFQLGQLRISNGGGSSSFGLGTSPYSSALQYWWKKLFGPKGPALTSTIDRQNYFFNRNWSIKGTIGYPSIPYLISQRTPRYGRLL